MDILDILRDPIFILPKDFYTGIYPVFIENCYSNFLSALDKIDEGSIVEKIKSNRETLEDFCEGIVRSAKTYYYGFPAKAYFEFENSNKQFQRNEMFHVPFEMREYVTTQRFSVPGLPCLYLSNSTYVCWEELRRPDINKMQVSRFKLENRQFKFLDISLTPGFLFRMLESITSNDSLEYFKQSYSEALDSYDILPLSFIMKWPLIAACSIKVKKQDASFKPEYIFPQFLLQWVTHNKKIDGIKYFSVEANISSRIDHSKYINYAIPIKEFSEFGYCKKLLEAFSLTEPISWEMLTMSNPNIIQHDQQKAEENLLKLLDAPLFVELIKGKEMNYWHTIFGKMEIEISEMPFEKIEK